MKHSLKIFSLLAGLMIMFASCDKVDDLTVYGEGKTPLLSATSLTLAPTAADSSNDVVTFSWTYPGYSTDSTNHKYVLEIDSIGRGFVQANKIVVTGGSLSKTLTAKQLNTILLGFGFAFNTAYQVEARVISSYGNNNEQKFSNILTMSVTPYKIPPRVPLPVNNRLFVTGGGTYFDWTNPNPMPAVRELTRLDETTWAGIFRMRGNSNYLLLPEAGSWANKFSVQDNSIPGSAEAGTFGFNLPQDFPANFVLGDNWYNMVYDFQLGRYTATKVDNPLSEDLFITGDATPSSWTNSPPVSQKFTQLTNGVFEITMAFVPGQLYKFLNTSGQWQPQFGGNSATGGTLGSNYGGGSDPDAIPTPATAGNYKITVNFHTKAYTVTPQ